MTYLSRNEFERERAHTLAEKFRSMDDKKLKAECYRLRALYFKLFREGVAVRDAERVQAEFHAADYVASYERHIRLFYPIESEKLA